MNSATIELTCFKFSFSSRYQALARHRRLVGDQDRQGRIVDTIEVNEVSQWIVADEVAAQNQNVTLVEWMVED